MTNVHWLEQSEADLPATNDWLSGSEISRLDSMRFEKRHKSWRLGRWTAKLAVVAYRNLPAEFETLRKIEILPASSGAPEVFFADEPAPVTISLSHRGGTGVCAVTTSGVTLGCDLEAVEPHSEAFTGDYFTDEEQELVARARVDEQSRLLTLLWSGKESALKALREGLRLDTRSVIVNLDDGFGVACRGATNSWFPFHVRCTGGQVFRGWWQISGNFVRTMVAAPPPAPPILLSAPVHSVARIR